MKKLHIHIAVDDLSPSINFYSAIFNAAPSTEHKDYAKWNLTEPAVNFAISQRGHKSGINHLGIQVDSEAELEEIALRLNQAEITLSEQKETSCCYAHSNKYWALDPQGIAWESFHTLNNIPVFGEQVKRHADNQSAACCMPSESKATGCCSS